MANTEAAPAESLNDEALVRSLAAIVGEANVETEEGRRLFFATDIFTSGKPVDAIVAPGNVTELAEAIRLAAAAERTVVPRGGGFSYTKGYVPTREGSISIDMRRMDAIREINETDLYVVVEAGCTWGKLYEALKEKGLRTPYFGPMSGHRATVGGALSQGSFFMGSTQYGPTAESVLGLEMVLADGSVVITGSGAGAGDCSPFYRHYGPDLTGIFLQDTGALGFKASAVLKLIPFPAHQRFATFSFPPENAGGALAAMTGIARLGIAGECYLWDPDFATKMATNNSLSDDVRYLTNVIKSGKGMFGGLRDGFELARTGKRFLTDNQYLLHVTFDDISEAGAQGRLDEATRIAVAAGGKTIKPSIPRALRAMPFKDFTVLAFADQRERNLPTHGIMPHSRIAEAATAVQAFFAENSERTAALGITIGTIFFAVGSNAVCCEPLFYWTDPQLAAHDRSTERSDLAALAGMPERSAAAELVAELRAELVALFGRFGAVHCQIGKSYPYRETRQPQTYALLQAIKDAVDPHNRINPGSLGL